MVTERPTRGRRKLRSAAKSERMHIVHVGDISTAAAAVMEHCHTCGTTNAGEPEVAGFFFFFFFIAGWEFKWDFLCLC